MVAQFVYMHCIKSTGWHTSKRGQSERGQLYRKQSGGYVVKLSRLSLVSSDMPCRRLLSQEVDIDFGSWSIMSAHIHQFRAQGTPPRTDM